MKNRYTPISYDPLEEKINIVTHAFGMFASVIALVLLILKSNSIGTIWHVFSFTVFGVSLIVLYTASTLYHASKKIKLRTRLNIFDHASIYVLIAGTYTPFTLITLQGKIGWWIFGINWTLALTGIILKLFFTGRYDKLSTIMYILMGWIIIVVIKPLITNLDHEGLLWLFIGGISYTIGAFFYSVNRIKYNHAIFHVFVLIGSFSHFISIYYYVI
ncbi:MAG: hemolysin III family protein [Saprospiraceae bacterium]